MCVLFTQHPSVLKGHVGCRGDTAGALPVELGWFL